MVIIASVLLVIAIVATILLFNKHPQNVDSNKPNFQALLPAGSSIEELGGWQKLTPPAGDAYYAFTDSIEQIPIVVSQQSLPETFKTSPSESIDQLAKAYSATETFETNNATVHIGNSVNGPQSVIFTKNGLLVLIKSQEKIENTVWARYINSLS